MKTEIYEIFSEYFDRFCFSKPLNIIIKNETESTNQDAKALGESGADDSLIIALKQTAGKGRLNRCFFSPSATGIYMSLLLHPDITSENTAFLTSIAAVAVASAAEKSSGVKTYIKWVNDIYQNDKKICGILCSSAFNSDKKPAYVIIGIGINLNDPENDFPEDIKNSASSLFGKKNVSAQQRTQLINDIVNRIFELIDTDIKAHLKEYKARSYLEGKTVSYVKDGENITAKVIGIDDDCRLLLRTNDGKDLALFAGEVSVKPI